MAESGSSFLHAAEDQCDLSGPYILSTNNAISHELMPMDLQKNCVAVAVAFTSFTIRVAGSSDLTIA